MVNVGLVACKGAKGRVGSDEVGGGGSGGGGGLIK